MYDNQEPKGQLHVCVHLLTTPTLVWKFEHYLEKHGAKGVLTRYAKLTWESAHACNLMVICWLIARGMTFLCMVHLSFNTNKIIYSINEPYQ